MVAGMAATHPCPVQPLPPVLPLLCVPPCVKRCIPDCVRFFIWLTYLGSDAIALYALATLFYSPRNLRLGVRVLRAPILLVHLGGQDSITAYNIEDHELWKRHVLTAVSQVSVAIIWI